MDKFLDKSKPGLLCLKFPTDSKQRKGVSERRDNVGEGGVPQKRGRKK